MVAWHEMPRRWLFSRIVNNAWRHSSYRSLRDGSYLPFTRHFMPGYHHLVPPGQRLVSAYVGARARPRVSGRGFSSFTNHLSPITNHAPPLTSHFSLLTSRILVHGSAMGSEDEPDHSDQDGITIGAIVLAAIPFFALILGPFIANRLEPRIFGLPFLLAYCVFWVLLTPVFLFCVDRLRKRR